MNPVIDWNNIMPEANRPVGKPPSASPDVGRGGPSRLARSIAIVYTAVYDARSAQDSIAKPLHERRRASLPCSTPSPSAARPSAKRLPRLDRSVSARHLLAAATVLRNFTGSDALGFFYSQDVPLKVGPHRAGERCGAVLADVHLGRAAGRRGRLHQGAGSAVGRPIE
jgi:hypothetical protein